MVSSNKSNIRSVKEDTTSNIVQNDIDIVKQYLISQQKPFSINDLVLNLNNKFKKVTLLKILDDLHKKDKIVITTFGKTLIFSCKDIDKEQLSTSNPLLLFEQLTQLKEEQAEMNRDLKHLIDSINNEKKNPSNKELPNLIGNLKIKIDQVKIAIEDLKNQEEENVFADQRSIINGDNCNIPQTNKELSTYIEKSEKILSKEMKSRKQIIKNILNLLLQSKKPQELKDILDDIGFEEIH